MKRQYSLSNSTHPPESIATCVVCNINVFALTDELAHLSQTVSPSDQTID